MQRELLQSPVQKLSHVDLILRRAGYFVYPSELLRLLARLPHDAQYLAIECELVEAARIRVRGVQHLIGPGRYADRPWRAVLRGRAFRRRHVALRGPCTGVEGHIDRHRSNESAVGIEH